MTETIEELIHEAVHAGPLPAKQLCDKMGVKYFTLMRQVNPTDDASSFPLKQLIGLMEAQKDFRILEKLNAACGFLPPVRPPRGFKSPGDQRIWLTQYQKDYSDMISLLYAFLAEPCREQFTRFEQAAKEHMAKTETLRRSAKKNLINQVEMDI